MGVLIFSCFMGFSLASFGQEASYIKAAPDELVVDGWRMIMPTINVDSATQDTWVRYDFPDGSYQSYPLDPGELITEKWYKPGVEGTNTTPAGYSIEATEEIKDWYMNGGEGTYKLEDGNWIPVVEEPEPPPAIVPDTDLGGGAAAPSQNTGGSSYSGSNIEVKELELKMNEAKKACQGVAKPDPKDCETYERLYKAYINKMSNP